MTCPHCGKRIHKTPSHVSAKGDGWEAICGPSEIVLGRLPDKSFDAIITDPPYGTGANSVSGRLASSASKYQNSDSKRQLPAFAGDSLVPEAWNEMMRAVLSQGHRVLRPGGEALLFCDWRSLNSMIAVAGSVGFGLRTVAVWNKGRGCRPSRNGFRSQSELIIHARKHGKLERPADVCLDGVLQHPAPRSREHVTQKPVALMAELLTLLPPASRVLDPFQGAGTTGVAAIQSGHTYLGIEATPHYHEVAERRIAEAAAAAAG